MEERRASLQALKDGDVRILICTDVAARGIDIEGLPYVINMTLPDEPEDYVHRIGRVGRADRMGLAFSIVAAAGVKEQVWYHKCANRGKNCSNRQLVENGGCSIWYDEPLCLAKIEKLLNQRILELEPDLSLCEELKALNVKYGEDAKRVEVEVNVHVAQLIASVRDLASMEINAQNMFLNLSSHDWSKF
jgi:ATP-dependent RNA helicase DDX1